MATGSLVNAQFPPVPNTTGVLGKGMLTGTSTTISANIPVGIHYFYAEHAVGLEITGGTFYDIPAKTLFPVEVFAAATSAKVTAAPDPRTVTFTARTLPTNQTWSNAVYGNGIYVAFPDQWSAGTAYATSTDGFTWTARTLPVSKTWAGLGFVRGKFVGYSYGAAGTAAIVTSTDGLNWTSFTGSYAYLRNFPVDVDGRIFIAGDTSAYSDDNGATWAAGSGISSGTGYYGTATDGVNIACSIGAAATGPSVSNNGGLTFGTAAYRRASTGAAITSGDNFRYIYWTGKDFITFGNGAGQTFSSDLQYAQDGQGVGQSVSAFSMPTYAGGYFWQSKQLAADLYTADSRGSIWHLKSGALPSSTSWGRICYGPGTLVVLGGNTNTGTAAASAVSTAPTKPIPFTFYRGVTG